MAKSENKTKVSETSADDFLAAVADEQQRNDARIIADMMARISGYPAKMWGPSIVGFGSYHYRYDSGREGDMCRIGFSPRKGKTVLYLSSSFPEHDALMARLGKCKMGKSCIYVKRLAEIDPEVLEQLVRESLNWLSKKYPE